MQAIEPTVTSRPFRKSVARALCQRGELASCGLFCSVRALSPLSPRLLTVALHTSTHSDAMADSLPVLRMAGVPEHFNWPFQLAIKRGLFHKAGVDVRWTDIKAGTGALINAAKSNEQDVIVALTEGLVADIVQGSELRLVSSYVESPLVWAISTGGRASAVNGVEDLKGQTIAVSRLTSGSHLMTCVLASQRGWKQDDVQYAVKGPFEALRAAVNDGSAAAFMWEQFMTVSDRAPLCRILHVMQPLHVSLLSVPCRASCPSRCVAELSRSRTTTAASCVALAPSSHPGPASSSPPRSPPSTRSCPPSALCCPRCARRAGCSTPNPTRPQTSQRTSTSSRPTRSPGTTPYTSARRTASR